VNDAKLAYLAKVLKKIAGNVFGLKRLKTLDIFKRHISKPVFI